MEAKNNDEFDYVEPTEVEDLCFLPEDLQVFEIKDPKQRVTAVQKRFFPRMHMLRDYALELIHEIYEIDPRKGSSYVNSPMPREDAKAPKGFEAVIVGIIGKGKNTALLDVKRQTGGAYNLHPSQLCFVVTADGTVRAEFMPFRYPKVSDEYVLAFHKLVVDCRDNVEALFAYGNLSHPFATELRPLRDLFGIRRHDMVLQRIVSPEYYVPIFVESLDQVVSAFIAMYPFYEYGRAVAGGVEPQFATLVDRLRAWQQRSE